MDTSLLSPGNVGSSWTEYIDHVNDGLLRYWPMPIGPHQMSSHSKVGASISTPTYLQIFPSKKLSIAFHKEPCSFCTKFLLLFKSAQRTKNRIQILNTTKMSFQNIKIMLPRCSNPTSWSPSYYSSSLNQYQTQGCFEHGTKGMKKKPFRISCGHGWKSKDRDQKKSTSIDNCLGHQT